MTLWMRSLCLCLVVSLFQACAASESADDAEIMSAVDAEKVESADCRDGNWLTVWLREPPAPALTCDYGNCCSTVRTCTPCDPTVTPPDDSSTSWEE